jgi:hypothetical protein
MEENFGGIYLNPFEVGHSRYHDHIFAFNKSLQSDIKKDLDVLFRDRSCLIATTGSDARLEKGPVSSVELMLFYEEGFDISSALKKLKNYVYKKNNRQIFYKNIEVKNPKTDKLYECYINDGSKEIRLVSPNRIFDLRRLYDPKDIFSDVLAKFFLELTSEKGRSLFEFAKQRVRDHKKVTLTGVQNYKGEEIFHYNLEEGVSFYNPSKSQSSFKQGPLRMVQYSLIRDLIKKEREGQEEAKSLFNLPHNTVEKLSRLEVEGKCALSSAQIGDISDCYKYFLHLYHKSQFEYRWNKGSKISFDKQEVRDRCSSLTQICSNRIIK